MWIAERAELGADHIRLHSMGRSQKEFIGAFAQSVLAQLVSDQEELHEHRQPAAGGSPDGDCGDNQLLISKGLRTEELDRSLAATEQITLGDDRASEDMSRQTAMPSFSQFLFFAWQTTWQANEMCPHSPN